MIYVTGDMHGDYERVSEKRLKKLKDGDTLIICGDFGFVWDGSQREQKLLKELGERKYNIIFVDGAHENHELLSKFRMTVFGGGRVQRISGRLYHAMRGEIFTIEGKKIFMCGGGESSDKDMRIETDTWYREEMPNLAELEHAADMINENGCEVDYIITHEPPSLVKSTMLLRTGGVDSVNRLNGFFEKINRECKFRHWYFGSMHEDKIITPVHTAVFNDIIPLE
ncbi:MAG: metallophosphoesterase [Acutalibacteraceae bacterium]